MRTLLALAALVLVAACGSSEGGADKAAVKEGRWSYVSGNGETVKVDHTPVRIIAHSDEAAALMSYGIKPVGIFGNEKPAENRNLKDHDLDGIAVLGTAWGEVDVEKAAALNPDLIVTDWWPAEKAYGGFENGVKAKSKKLADLAPVIGGSQGKSLVETIAYYEGLAASLGADVAQGADEKEAFEAAVARFRKATAAKPGLTVMAMSPADDMLYVGNPPYSPELMDFGKWGLKVLAPKSPDPSFPYWENLSWEKADSYQPDLVLMDDRAWEQSQKIAAKQPTWKSIRAVAAGAVVPWPAYWIHTYASYAEQLDELAAAIENARADIGS
ncbi:MAG: ABC transporter substrate-binding protein [Nocardioidaceae bacterium]|nr:ABC transporter substrate-binding protein [Nocardioidaceae bacterium]